MNRRTILVVDDDSSVRMLLRRLLESQGWGVREVVNGSQAIESCAREHPDLVILDLAMPAMNGLQAGRRISQTNPALPMLLVSVEQVTRQLAKAAWDVGFQGAVTKSKGTEVIQAVEAIFRGKTFFAVDESLAV